MWVHAVVYIPAGRGGSTGGGGAGRAIGPLSLYLYENLFEKLNFCELFTYMT